MILDYSDFLNESGPSKAREKASPAREESFQNFASNRLQGASKISSAAKEKGGDALLTYHHFRVKLPYYEEAVKGNFDPEATEEELETKLKELTKGLSKNGITQVEFQKLMGEIEVLGELHIRHNS